MTQETKLTEPVQAGLWYQTNGGSITCINHDVGDCPYPMHANNGQCYDREGKLKWYNDFYDLIKCLGADPFNQAVNEYGDNNETSYTRTDIHEQTKAELERTDKTLKDLSKSYVELSHGAAQQALELERVKQSHAELKEKYENENWQYKMAYRKLLTILVWLQIPTNAANLTEKQLFEIKRAIANAEKVVGNDNA
jgi:hypothetical protein